MPLLIAVGDLKAAHRVAGSVNLRLRPFVKLANKVDYGRVARVLDLIPDETGIAEVGAAMCRILDRVDLERAADLLGQIEELTWSAAGAAGARLGRHLSDTDIDVADVVDVGRKLVSLTVDTARDPDEGVDAHTGLLSELISPRFKELAKDLTRIVAKQAITDPSAIIRDAVAAKEFYSGHAHTDYARFVVDELGRTAIAWLGDWLAESIDAAADVPKRAAPRRRECCRGPGDVARWRRQRKIRFGMGVIPDTHCQYSLSKILGH